MKRPLWTPFVPAATALIACTYGLVRYAFGLTVPAAQQDLGLSTGAVGVVSGLTSVAYCLAAAVAFACCQRWPRTVVAAAGGVAVAGSLGVAVAGSATLFAASVVLASAGAGAASPGLVVLVRRAVPGPDEPRAQAVVNAGTGPGLVAAGAVALLLAQRWQAGWLVAAVATALVTVAVLALSRGAAGGPVHRVRPDVGPGWVGPLVVAVLLGAGSAAVWTHGRAVLEDRGLVPDAAVGVWVCLGVGATGAAWAAPRLLRAGVPTAMTGSLLLTAAGTAGFAVPPVGPVPAVAAIAFGLGFTAATSVLIGWAAEVSATPGPAVSAFFVALLLGQGVGAPVASALLGRGVPVAFGAAAVVVLVAAGVTRATTRGPGPCGRRASGGDRPDASGGDRPDASGGDDEVHRVRRDQPVAVPAADRDQGVQQHGVGVGVQA
ncbi:MFS transporter [Modestobacter sp. Leaf380]|uniref:MFS transporter n=1 Tax=Modestobacter sp. Leaf380 TaxID=1736356 RepID=UPI0009E9A574|nr:MFS transporter [Modestobacter sp. Leaf380]